MSMTPCPFCGSPNETEAAACRVCGVDFTRLPDDLKPKFQAPEANDPSSLTSADEDQSGIPAWLRKRMKNQSEPSEAVSFDSFLDALLGKSQQGADEQTRDSADGSLPGLFDEADLNALEAGRDAVSSAELTDEEQKYTDFSQFRPEKKWEEAAASDGKIADSELSVDPSSPADEKDYADFSHFRPEKKWEDGSQSESEEAPAVADESAFADFSHFRPEKKWEDVSQGEPKETPAVADESAFADFSHFRPEKKWDDRVPLAMDPVAPEANRISDSLAAPLEEPDYARSLSGKKSDDQLALFDTLQADNDSSPTDYETMGLEQAELPYVDFSVNRPARKWDDSPDEEVSEKDIREASDQLLSVHNESSDPDSDTPAVLADNGGLVGNFLNQITNPSQENPDTASEPCCSQSESPVTLENPGAGEENDLDFLFESHPEQPAEPEKTPVADVLEPEEQPKTSAAVSDAMHFDFDFQDNVTPGVGTADSSLDEVPWNLFDSDLNHLPGSAAESSYAAFSKGGLDQPGNVSDYQERMVTAILDKIFKIEGINHPFVRSETRKSNRFAQVFVALMMILGIGLILFTNLSDPIPLKMPAAEKFPNLIAFNQALDEVEPESQTLIVVDYPPGYASELSAPLETLLKTLSQKKVKTDLVAFDPMATTLMASLTEKTLSSDVRNLGYRAGGVIGFSDLISNADASYTNIYLITAGFNSVVRWVEQSAMWSGDVPIHVITSARLESLIEPYRQSDVFASQLTGVMEKQLFSGALADNTQTKRRIIALWFVLGMAIFMIVAGYFARNPFRSIVAVSEDEDENDAPAGKAQRKESLR